MVLLMQQEGPGGCPKQQNKEDVCGNPGENLRHATAGSMANPLQISGASLAGK